jgi:hypothetical protein
MLADLLSEEYDGELDEYWERERTATPVRAFAVRLHATGCSLRETLARRLEAKADVFRTGAVVVGKEAVDDLLIESIRVAFVLVYQLNEDS